MSDASTVAAPPAENPQSEPAPELFPEATPQNENTPAPIVAPTSRAKKVRELAAGVLQNFGFKKGRGRPKKCRECDGATGGCPTCDFTGFEPGKGDAVLEGSERRVERVPEPALGVPAVARTSLGDSVRAAAFRRAVGAAIKGVVRLLTSLVRVRASQAGLDKEFISKAIEIGSPAPQQIEDFSNSLDAVLKKHGVEPEHCEEWTLAIDGLNLFSGFPAMFAMFREEIERKKLAEKKEGA